eukprot:PLAT3070.1.p1 GENE.PLAT3070.1~~PLAT3070.1.p1  ORF type:complete len:385 (+),score=139.29 PLAT3070.1:299-1453(+)
MPTPPGKVPWSVALKRAFQDIDSFAVDWRPRSCAGGVFTMLLPVFWLIYVIVELSIIDYGNVAVQQFQGTHGEVNFASFKCVRDSSMKDDTEFIGGTCSLVPRYTASEYETIPVEQAYGGATDHECSRYNGVVWRTEDLSGAIPEGETPVDGTRLLKNVSYTVALCHSWAATDGIEVITTPGMSTMVMIGSTLGMELPAHVNSTMQLEVQRVTVLPVPGTDEKSHVSWAIGAVSNGFRPAGDELTNENDAIVHVRASDWNLDIDWARRSSSIGRFGEIGGGIFFIWILALAAVRLVNYYIDREQRKLNHRLRETRLRLAELEREVAVARDEAELMRAVATSDEESGGDGEDGEDGDGIVDVDLGSDDEGAPRTTPRKGSVPPMI